MANQISCVVKRDRQNPWERIELVGGVNADGSRWQITQQDAIDRIESRRNKFFVKSGSKSVDVVVAVSRFGHKYIKTVADDHESNNLLSLSTCLL